MDRLGGTNSLSRQATADLIPVGGYRNRKVEQVSWNSSLPVFLVERLTLASCQTALHHQLQSFVVNRLREKILCPGFERGQRLVQRRIVVNQYDRNSRAKVIDQ